MCNGLETDKVSVFCLIFSVGTTLRQDSDLVADRENRRVRRVYLVVRKVAEAPFL